MGFLHTLDIRSEPHIRTLTFRCFRICYVISRVGSISAAFNSRVRLTFLPARRRSVDFFLEKRLVQKMTREKLGEKQSAPFSRHCSRHSPTELHAWRWIKDRCFKVVMNDGVWRLIRCMLSQERISAQHQKRKQNTGILPFVAQCHTSVLK